jgi:H+/Cl- antiporter ClcA
VQKNWSFSEITNRSAFLLAGAASGLAAAFNTPLGGIVYVVEELAKSHLNTFRTGVLHSVIFAGVFTQMIMGPYLYFGYPKVEGFKFSLLFQYMTISICGALFVTLMAQTLKAIVLFRREKRKFLENTFVACCCGALFAAVILFVSAHAAGGGKELLNGLIFKSQIATFGDVIGRYVGTILTYANGGAGGIFAPTLSLGGAASSYFDSIFQFQLGPLAVLLGMTSGLAALTHSPLTSFILILEMTDRHNSIIPLMIAAIIGHGVSKIISKKSFYETVFEHLLNDLENKKDVQKT